MDTKVTAAAGLDEAVHVYKCGAPSIPAVRIFRDSELLVIDDIAWAADLDVIRSALEPRRRAFKGPYQSKETTPEVRAELEKMYAQGDRLFNEFYAGLTVTKRHRSFRPMITGPDPMHYDSIDGPMLLTAYINVAPTPRSYQIGPSLPKLIVKRRAAVMETIRECRGDLGRLSYVIRTRTEKGRPPIDAQYPRHRVEMAPGSMWFFDAKTVSHEVLYGEGVAGMSWEVPGSTLTQREHLAAHGLVATAP